MGGALDRPNSRSFTLANSAANSFNAQRTLEVNGKSYTYFGLPEAGDGGLGDISRLPVSLKILLENLLRHEDGRSVTADDVHAVADWVKERRSDREIAFSPARVLMQDLTGVPAIVDLAAMRQAM
ncbi:MAG: aconitate hydratase, partial [Alphaproteobacteria bacterium]|nr:aconitate hydratase [Alphaproteobacteria bacterium]